MTALWSAFFALGFLRKAPLTSRSPVERRSMTRAQMALRLARVDHGAISFTQMPAGCSIASAAGRPA
eukprot:9049817-Pyramimonas_sp.AAC.1